MMSRPGDGAVNGRRVAVLVADGIDSASTRSVYAGLLAAGAVPRFVGRQLGQVTTVEGKGTGAPINVEISMAAGPSVLYDAVVIPDGKGAADMLASNAVALDFIKEQYRHCKPMLVLGSGSMLLGKVSISDASVASTKAGGNAEKNLGANAGANAGVKDPGLIEQREMSVADALTAFIGALAKHRALNRESDPPQV